MQGWFCLYYYANMIGGYVRCPRAPPLLAGWYIIWPMYIEVHLGDIVRLRKKHPCGSFEWEVVRLGADIGLVCQGCRRRVLLQRGEFNKQLKTIVTVAKGE